jgi:AraC-like DNA-binding protein
MSIFDITPLLSLVIGIFLLVFILFRKSGLGNDKKIRYILATIVFLYTFTAFDYYITINNKGDTAYFGISYLLVHLFGFLLYYFVVLFTNTTIRLKKWVYLVLGYTLLRWSFFLPLLEYNSLQEFISFVKASRYDKWLEWEYVLVNLINILLFVRAFFRLKESPLVLELNEKEQQNYKWIKLIFIAFVVLQLGILISDIVGNFQIETYENFEAYEANMKFESLLIAIFFFVFTFSVMQFPVFVFTGDFEDLSKSTKKKYAKSSLTDSSELFNEIYELLESEKLYLDCDLKLNSLSERLGKSVHHISQAINQNTQMSFPDFVNSFRIEDAKKRLLEPKPDTIYTICLDVGFNSKTAFYSAFKKNTSQTPTEFKKTHKTKEKA